MSKPARDLSAMRDEYRQRGLNAASLAADPLEQFARWLDDAIAAGTTEANAMTLATASVDGQPSARTVLLKGLTGGGFVFFTNYHSRKGRELEANPAAALVFVWRELSRQVCVTGTAAPIDPEESDAYWATRPREANLSAAASPQSNVVASRAELEERVAALQSTYPDTNIPRPAHWGGIRVTPKAVEFWQGQPARLHDRLRYRREGGRWIIERLAP